MVEITAFWLTAFLLAFTYAGYPALLWLLVRLKPRHATGVGAPPASLTVAVVLVVRNEEARLAARLQNLFDTAPPALQEVMVVCDGCTDGTALVAESFAERGAKVLRMELGQGKPAGVNAGLAAATADVVVLCDARQRFAPDAMTRLLAFFADSSTGAVSGALEIERSTTGAGQGVDAYWKLEKVIRRLESDLDSSVGCTGAVYAIRRRAFQPIPEDTILDDVVIPMQIAAQGLRVRFCPEAVAFDPQALGGAAEHRRKVRTLAGNFQMLFRYPQWLLPWRHRLWWKLVAHKYLRLAGPLLLFVLIYLSWSLRGYSFFTVALVAQVGGYGLAMLAGRMGGMAGRLAGMASGFLFLQVCIVGGFLSWLSSKPKNGWK